MGEENLCIMPLRFEIFEVELYDCNLVKRSVFVMLLQMCCFGPELCSLNIWSTVTVVKLLMKRRQVNHAFGDAHALSCVG